MGVRDSVWRPAANAASSLTAVFIIDAGQVGAAAAGLPDYGGSLCRRAADSAESRGYELWRALSQAGRTLWQQSRFRPALLRRAQATAFGTIAVPLAELMVVTPGACWTPARLTPARLPERQGHAPHAGRAAIKLTSAHSDNHRPSPAEHGHLQNGAHPFVRCGGGCWGAPSVKERLLLGWQGGGGTGTPSGMPVFSVGCRYGRRTPVSWPG